MELQNAHRIVESLVRGFHPVTGEVMPQDSPYRAPAVVEALSLLAKSARHELEPRPRREMPANAGKPWPPEEDARLASVHQSGADLKQLAIEFGRTAFAVESRLIKLGKLPPRVGRFGPPGG